MPYQFQNKTICVCNKTAGWMHEESGIDSWKGQNIYPQHLYHFQGPKSDVTYPLVVMNSFCDPEVYCSPPCNTMVTSVWSPAFTRCYTKVPKIWMPHENRLLYSCVLLSISAKQHSAVRTCFFCAFLWRCGSAVMRSYRPAKMTDVKEQWFCIKFCFKFSKTASESHRMLKEAFDDNARGKTQTSDGLSISRTDKCHLMMKSILDDLLTEPRPKMWQNCERLSWKTDEERFTMFATLSDCCMECASEFRRMSSTCGTLQQNLCQGWQHSSSCVARCAAVFGFNEHDSHPPPSLLTGPCPL